MRSMTGDEQRGGRGKSAAVLGKDSGGRDRGALGSQTSVEIGGGGGVVGVLGVVHDAGVAGRNSSSGNSEAAGVCGGEYNGEYGRGVLDVDRTKLVLEYSLGDLGGTRLVSGTGDT